MWLSCIYIYNIYIMQYMHIYILLCMSQLSAKPSYYNPTATINQYQPIIWPPRRPVSPLNGHYEYTLTTPPRCWSHSFRSISCISFDISIVILLVKFPMSF